MNRSDPLWLASKLRPLIPQDVARWLRARESAGPELAQLIDEQIRQTARRLLSDDQAPLLSFPPANALKGPIKLGTVLYAGERGDAGLTTTDLLSNVAIFGRSGAGKTNAVFHLLLQLEDQGVPWLFLDWKRTARHLMPRLARKPDLYTPGRSLKPLLFNPFTPPPAMEPRVYAAHLVDTLAEAYDLGDGAVSVLQQALLALYTTGNLTPTVEQVLRVIDETPAKGRALGWTASARRALRSLDLLGIGEADRTPQHQLAQRLLNRCTIVELDSLSASARRFLVPTLCLWLYHQRLASREREQLKLVIVVEEAHHLLLKERQRGSEAVMGMLLRQCREIGIGMVIVDQHPHMVSSAALGNTAVTLVLNLKDPADIAKAAGLCGLDEEDKGVLSRLPIGQAVVKLQDRYRRPFLVQVPHVAVEKGAATDAVLSGGTEGVAGSAAADARSAGSRPDGADGGAFGQVQPADRPLSEDALSMLEDVFLHPDSGVRERYARLRMSGERGNRVKRSLLHGGWLEQQVVAISTARKTLLRVTQRSRGLRPQGGSFAKGSIEHEYWRRYYRRRLVEGGYAVRVEAPRPGGRIDLLARRGREVVAFEFETGKSDALANIEGCLRAGIPHTIVVATNIKAFTRLRQQLKTSEESTHRQVRAVYKDYLFQAH